MARHLGLQILRGLLINIPTLLIGELYLATDTHGLYIGTAGGNVLLNAGSVPLNLVQATIDFGSDTGPITRHFDATATVAATWVTSGSIIICSLAGIATPQHGIEDGLIEGMTTQAESLVAGVGFTVHAYSPLGSWGKYVFNCVGA